MKKNSTDGSESRPYLRDVIGRRALPHDPPLSIDTSKAVFFITICCKQRGKNQLCHSAVVPVLFDAVRFYEGNHKWFVHLMVVMPDHVHFLASFAMDVKMKDLIACWKRFTSTRAAICWQRDFFDHRLRSDESFDEKAAYILQNPVRAGLAARAEDWPYILMPE
jgi:putative transposase